MMAANPECVPKTRILNMLFILLIYLWHDWDKSSVGYLFMEKLNKIANVEQRNFGLFMPTAEIRFNQSINHTNLYVKC